MSANEMIPPCKRCGGDIDECQCPSPRMSKMAFRELNGIDEDELDAEFSDWDFNFHDDD